MKRVIAITQGNEDSLPEDPREKPLDHLILSCDASIKVNPGGPAAVAAIAQFPSSYNIGAPERYVNNSNAMTNNVAEYEAVYFGLTTLLNRHNNPACVIEVRSDSKLVIGQLNNEMECNDTRLKHLRDTILEYCGCIPVPVYFTWWPRCSTPELKLANDLAQTQIGVAIH